MRRASLVLAALMVAGCASMQSGDNAAVAEPRAQRRDDLGGEHIDLVPDRLPDHLREPGWQPPSGATHRISTAPAVTSIR